MSQEEENQEIEAQSVGTVASFILLEGAKSIIGFIALSFFAPV